MSNVIRFLESMGASAAMSRMTAADYEAAIAMLDAEEPSREALRLRDRTKLIEILNGRPMMVCGIVAPEEQPDRPESPQSPDEDRPTPDEESPSQ